MKRYANEETWRERDEHFSVIEAEAVGQLEHEVRPEVASRLANQLELAEWEDLRPWALDLEPPLVAYLASRAALESVGVDVGAIFDKFTTSEPAERAVVWEATMQSGGDLESFPQGYRSASCLVRKEPRFVPVGATDRDEWGRVVEVTRGYKRENGWIMASCAQESRTGSVYCDVDWVSGEDAEDFGVPLCSVLPDRPPRRKVFEGFEVEL